MSLQNLTIKSQEVLQQAQQLAFSGLGAIFAYLFLLEAKLQQ